jgi:hypothetical protein
MKNGKKFNFLAKKAEKTVKNTKKWPKIPFLEK